MDIFNCKDTWGNKFTAHIDVEKVSAIESWDEDRTFVWVIGRDQPYRVIDPIEQVLRKF